MADGPCIPLEGHLGAGLDGHIFAIALALLVAYDVDLAEAIRRHEAIVEIVGLPSYGLGDGILVPEGGVPTLIFHAVGDDLVDVAVGSHEGQYSHQSSAEGKHSV